MIYTELTIKAMKLAYDAHLGQTDKTGVPYIFHPVHLAEQMTDETTTCIALLHDVVEDTDVTMEELEQEFPEKVTGPLRLLTHTEKTGLDGYISYIEKICGNKDATIVKKADLEHNMDESRLIGVEISEEQRRWWRKKYSAAEKLLNLHERR